MSRDSEAVSEPSALFEEVPGSGLTSGRLVERLRRAEALLRAAGHELEADAVRSVIEAS